MIAHWLGFVFWLCIGGVALWGCWPPFWIKLSKKLH
jgi:hypothetical protein